MKEKSFIRTAYLYLFSLIGLTLLVIGVVRFIDMGLKAFVFTQAEYEYEFSYPAPIYRSIEETEDLIQNGRELSQREINELETILENYKNWMERQESVNPLTSRRHREASNNLAMILVGLPLYFYHWNIIRKESKKDEISK